MGSHEACHEGCGSSEGHEGHEEEGSHEACHEGSGCASKGHEGHEEEGSHEARHEGSGSSEGHEGDEEGSHEACHEGSGCAKEGHEGHEVNLVSGFCSGCGDVYAFERCRHDCIGYVENH